MKFSMFTGLLLCLLFSSACEVTEIDNRRPVGDVEGVRPIYAAAIGWDEIVLKEPQPIEFLGKIYYKDPYIYVNERNKGIHILDNTNPVSPLPVAFIQVLGSEDIAIKGNILYADNITDLVAIDISDLSAIAVTSRVKGLYEEGKKDYPDGYNGYFECVDSEKGIVIGWEKVTLTDPTCLR